MLTPKDEFRVNESFTEKVLGMTVFNGKVVIAREDGVFMQGDDDVFRRVDPGPPIRMIVPPVGKVIKC